MARRAFPSKQIGLAEAFAFGSSASKLSSGTLKMPAQGESVLDILKRPAQGESVPEDSEKKMRYDQQVQQCAAGPSSSVQQCDRSDALSPSSRCSSARQQEPESLQQVQQCAPKQEDSRSTRSEEVAEEVDEEVSEEIDELGLSESGTESNDEPHSGDCTCINDRWTLSWPPPVAIEAEAVASGKTLDILCGIICSCVPPKIISMVKRNIANFPPKLTYVSFCTGSGMDCRVLESIHTCFASRGLDTEFQCVGMCESALKKRIWNGAWANYKHGACPCIFMDMKYMGNETAPCWSHGFSSKKERLSNSKEEPKHCNVPRADLAFCGSSCKYFSHANHQKQHGSNEKFMSTDAGKDHQSYITLKGFLAYLKKYKPSMFVWENVEAVADGDQQDKEVNNVIKYFERELSPEGYEIQVNLCEASFWGLPQDRKRIYAVGVLPSNNLFCLDDVTGFFASCREFLSATRMPSPSLHLVLQCSHGLLQHCLKDLLEVRQEIASKRVGKAGNTAWETRHINYCRQKQIRFSTLKASAAVRENAFYSTLREDQQQLIAIAQEEFGEDLCIDLTQSLGTFSRVVPKRDDMAIATLMPANDWWISLPERQGLLLGREALMLQGFPHHQLDEVVESDTDLKKVFSESFAMDLAGNAFSGTVVLVLLLALFLTLPWKEDVGGDGERELLRSVLDLLG